jgi:hypothetical protein
MSKREPASIQSPAKCKNRYCDQTGEHSPLEASGYCFACAEEIAGLLAEEGEDPSSAWRASDAYNGR